jgi:carbon-monoxide dehydrogenase medium subunit
MPRASSARISVNVDGVDHLDEVEPRLLLVHYLRDRLGRTGTPIGCDTGNLREEGQDLVVGAMTTHHDVVRDRMVRTHAGLLAQAAATVADPAVRHRATLGGSLAHADPAGDLPAVCLALDATMVVLGPQGYRTVPAAEFFVDYLQTALRPDELLTEIRLPRMDGWGFHYEKFHRTAQAWAVVGVAAAVRRERDGGGIAEARIGLVNMGARPMRAHLTETALTGAAASEEAIGRAATMAAEGAHPPTDLHGSAEYREHLARVLTRRAVMAAAGAAGPAGSAGTAGTAGPAGTT